MSMLKSFRQNLIISAKQMSIKKRALKKSIIDDHRDLFLKEEFEIIHLELMVWISNII